MLRKRAGALEPQLRKKVRDTHTHTDIHTALEPQLRKRVRAMHLIGSLPHLHGHTDMDTLHTKAAHAYNPDDTERKQPFL